MNDIQATVAIVRGLIQLGITAEEYQEAVNNPDMTNEELAEHLESNAYKIRQLRDIDHD